MSPSSVAGRYEEAAPVVVRFVFDVSVVEAVDGEIRRIQREITGTFSVMNGTIIAGSENLPAEKSIALLNSLRACIPEVRSAIRLADTRLTSLLM